MQDATQLAIFRTTFAMVLAAASIVGCADGDLDEGDVSLEVEETDALDDAYLDPNPAESPTLQAAIADGLDLEGKTLRDIMHLLPPESLPDDLTDEELDFPVVYQPNDFPETTEYEGASDFAAGIDPVADGEAACATTSIANPANGAQVALSPPHPYGCLVQDGSTSPDASYNPNGCPSQYITEVTGTYGRPLSFYWNWHGTNLTQTTCNFVHVSQSAFGQYLSITFVNGYWQISEEWTKIGTTRLHGQWVSGPLFSYCNMVHEQGSAPLPSLQQNHIYQRVRTATRGLAFAVWIPVMQRVEGGVRQGQVCIY